MPAPRTETQAPPVRRILIVDDNRDAAQALGSLLELDRHEVQAAFSGPQALEAIDAFRPEVVLLDLGLPGFDGYEVARRIRARTPQGSVCLVAVTGYGQASDRDRSRAAGCVAHLVKPVEYSVLQELLVKLPVAPAPAARQ